MTFLALLALAVSAQPAVAVSSASAIEIRFCPETSVHPYPLDSLRGVQGLLLQNVAIVNRSAVPISLKNVTIALSTGAGVTDERRFGAAQVVAAAKAGSAAKAQGMFDLAAFQFCDGRLLDGAVPAQGSTLAPGEALLLMQNVFAYKGSRDRIQVTADGEAGSTAITASAALPIDASSSKTELRWPLRRGRTWFVASGASFHTTHRWARPEEFAVDIVAVDANGSTHRGQGRRNSDFHAYGAEVVAAADGLVFSVLRGAAEDPPMLRRPDESMASYYGRIGERQAANLARGELGATGNSVVIDHGNGEYSIYGHLAPGSVTVTAGDRVKAGTVIGKLGSSGNSTEPHLHFQVCDRPSSLSCSGIPPTGPVRFNPAISSGPNRRAARASGASARRQGMSTVEPVVCRASSARCESAASESG